jgi:hypothetical protein
MQVQVHTDNHIEGHERLSRWVESVVTDALSRFEDRITSVQVHLGDENSDKGGDNDKRCMMEVRIEGRPPTAVTHHAATVDQAVDGAAERAQRAVEHILEKQRDR